MRTVRPVQSLFVAVVCFFALMLVLMMQGCTASTNGSTPDPQSGDTTAPTAPSALSAVATSSTQIGLSWTAATDNVGVTGYRVERCSGANCSSFAQLATTSGTTFADSGMSASTSYSYRVRATDAAGNLGAYSNIASATTPASSDTQAPTAPANLQATAASSTQANLIWTASTDNVGVAGYKVERCTGNGCTSFVQITSVTGTAFSDSGLLSGTSYGYRVRAADAAGNLSGYSNLSYITTTGTPDTQAPTAPAGLAAAASSSTQIGLSWTASTDNVSVTGYQIERCSGSSCASFTQIAATTGATTFTDIGLTASTTYRYRVRANDAAGNLSAYSNIASATTNASSDTQAPTAPSGLAATASSSSQIGLTWVASTDNVGVTGYRIERCVGASCTAFAQIGTTAGTTTFTDSGLAASTTYRYRVRANDAEGNLSAYSNIASATTTASTDTQAPSAPSGLAATASSSSQIGLSWTASTDNVGVTGYRIERCAGASCTAFAQVGTTAGTTTFADSGLTASTAYRYRVRANDAAGNLSAYSNIASATTTASTDTQAPTAPSGLSATASSSSQIGLSWTASTDNVGVTGYRIERCAGASCTAFVQIGTTAGTTTFTDSGLAASTAYRYRVRANDAAGNLSAYSNIATATTSASSDTQAPSAPSGLSATASSSSQIGLTWVASTDNVGVTGYRIERCAGASCTTFAQVGTTTGTTTFADSGLTASSAYRYRVRANDAAGNLSAYSNIATATTSASSDTQAPTAPSGLSATASSSSQIGLSWTASTDNVGVTGYRIERCAGASCTSFAQIATTTGATTFTDTGLSASTSYSYRVRANDAAGNLSGYSNTASATTSAGADTQAPTAPSGLTATASSSSQIGLSWTASTDNVGVTGYRIERCAGASCTSFAQIGTTTGATTFTDSGLTASTDYSYRVRANDAAGNLSGYSNTASATTPGGGSSITVSVSPKRGGLTVSRTISVTATLTNDTGNQGVTWSFASTGSTSGGGFSPASSTSGNAVTFTAPSAAGVVTITATAVGDPSKSATATLGITNLSGVTTYHNNLSRDGTNQQEYALTTANVSSTTFGRLFSCTVDGAVYAQPLWVSNVTIGGAQHNVLIVATMHDSIYAFDADSSPCVTLWHANLLDSAHGGTGGEVPAPSFGAGSLLGAGSGDIAPAVGILGTPVIDGNTKTIYAVTKSENTTTLQFFQRLHAIDLTTGAEKFGGPAQINSSITVAGTGDGSSGGAVPFDAQHENQRPGLALVNGIVYVSWASHEDVDPYHGWVLGFNAGNLALSKRFNSSPNGGRSGIWMSGGAPAADSSNNLYVMTGNGSFDADTGGSDYGSSYLKLSTASGLTVSDYFTPHNQDSLSMNDQDVGAGGTALLFGQNLMVGAGKSGAFYVLNRSNMGHFNSSSDAAAVQTWTASRAFSTPAFWNNTMYYFGVVFGSEQVGVAYDFNSSTGLFNIVPSSQTPSGYGFPGATPSVSSSGSTNGIVWAINSNAFCTGQARSCGPAVLHAYDANNLATELWNSTQGSGNAAGLAVKFTVPTVANGKVYVGNRGNNTGGDDSSTSIPGQIDVYGLLPN